MASINLIVYKLYSPIFKVEHNYNLILYLLNLDNFSFFFLLKSIVLNRLNNGLGLSNTWSGLISTGLSINFYTLVSADYRKGSLGNSQN